MRVRSGFLFTLIFLGFAGLFTSPVAAQDAGDLCATPGNLSVNCRFDAGFRGVPGTGSVANGYGGYTNSGSPDFNGRDCDSPEPPCQRVWSDGGLWEAGIYQQISNLTPGQGYRARIGWLTAMCDDPANEGRIGIDPTGGTNQNSPAIVWSNWTRLNKSNSYGVHQVKTSARNSTITVFISAKFQMQCNRGNAIWFDAFILVPDGSASGAVPTVAAPTDTPRPVPTNTRAPAPRAATPVPPTNTPTSAPTATASATATATPTATDMDTPSPTATETDTPSPTATRRPTPTPTLLPVADAIGPNTLAMGLIGASGCSLLFALAMGAFAFWFWRRQ